MSASVRKRRICSNNVGLRSVDDLISEFPKVADRLEPYAGKTVRDVWDGDIGELVVGLTAEPPGSPFSKHCGARTNAHTCPACGGPTEATPTALRL